MCGDAVLLQTQLVASTLPFLVSYRGGGGYRAAPASDGGGTTTVMGGLAMETAARGMSRWTGEVKIEGVCTLKRWHGWAVGLNSLTFRLLMDGQDEGNGSSG